MIVALVRFALLTSLFAQASQPLAQPPPSIAAAQTKLAANDVAGAKDILEKLVAAVPTNFAAWNMLGATHRRLGDGDAAVVAYQRALTLAPSNFQIMFEIGVSHALRKDADAAFLWLGKARASGRVDMTQMEGRPALNAIRSDPRFTALIPTAADFAKPFIEPVKVLREWTGEGSNDQFGWIARSIGDVDGDRAQDVVISASTSSAGSRFGGRVHVYSSKKGTLLWTADGKAGEQFGTGLEAAGDVNGDGAGDVIASTPGLPGTQGYAKVFNGRTGEVLMTLTAGGIDEAFGQCSAGIGDVNRDGVPDLLVGAPGSPQAPAAYPGRAYIFSGKNGALLLTLSGERGGDRFGAAVTGVSRDGKFVFAVGAPGAGPSRAGRVFVHTALTAKPAWLIDADATGSQLGAMFLSIPGDLDGDGADDVYASDWTNTAKGPTTGRVYLHSAKTGRLLSTLTGETAGEGFGTSPSRAGDVDGDRVPDLIVGAWQYSGGAAGAGRAYLHSGKTGELLKTFTDRIPGDALGFDAVGIGDVDGDGTVDLLLSAAWSGIRGFHSGRVFIVSSGITRR